MNENNYVELVGTVGGVPEFSHNAYNEDFYTFPLIVKRTSGIEDEVPLLISGDLVEIKDIDLGIRIKIFGQVRSFDLHLQNHDKLVLNILVDDIYRTEDNDKNTVILGGYICKNPIHRSTLLGREITDILIAINRVNGKSDYVPLVVWGRNAKCSSNYNVGDYVEVNGRFQSRTYTKIISDKVKEMRIAYEVSVNHINKKEI